MKHAFVVAGTHSGVGKTSVSTALMAAFRRRGLSVQGFKIGPDFIDPGFHSSATLRAGRNLDGWMLDRNTNNRIFARAAADADVAIIEGVMGLFDGASSTDEQGSTAEMAKWLGLPVILVIDASAQARSAAAMVRGFETFDADLRLIGVIANRVAGTAHYQYIEEAIRSKCKAEPLGWLADERAVTLPSRHLGLVTAPEVMNQSRLDALADWIEAGIDLNRLLTLSISPESPESLESLESRKELRPSHSLDSMYSLDFSTSVIDYASNWKPAQKSRVRIGVARDRAFCFYYQDNLDLLEEMGAELVFWSPVEDALPKSLHGLYFGGGYPELYAERLSANACARRAVNEFVSAGGAVYAECGGLMYLAEAIIETGGREHLMAGVLPTRAVMHERLVRLSYTEVEGLSDYFPLLEGESARGHEFRYSEIEPMPETIKRCYRLRSSWPGHEPVLEGYMVNNCLASYVHLHFLSNPNFARRWLETCLRSNVTT